MLTTETTAALAGDCCKKHKLNTLEAPLALSHVVLFTVERSPRSDAESHARETSSKKRCGHSCIAYTKDTHEARNAEKTVAYVWVPHETAPRRSQWIDSLQQ